MGVAATLQSSARPGSVLVGPATRAAIGDLFTWGAGEEVTLGGSTPLVASYLEAPRARAAERRPRLGGQASLTGRDEQMRVPDTALRAAVAGRGSVVLLRGEAGLGKTRLVQECRKRFIAWVGAGSGRLPLWLEGRCASYTSDIPYSVYRQLVASWIGLAPDQPEARLRSALETALSHLLGNANLLPPLARMMGVSRQRPGATAAPDTALAARGRMSPEEVQRATFGAVRSVVSRFAAVGPTVLVLEDLHWADPTSLRLTRDLAELAAGRPLLILATARLDASPEVASLADAPGAGKVQLWQLDGESAEALARSLIGDVVGSDVLPIALAGAEGNPLFLEERLSSLIETGTLVRERGTWWLRDAPGPELPQVLERLVRSRVDRLSPAAQEAMRAASVLGAEFSPAVLAAVLGVPRAELSPVLDELTASDLAHPEPHGGGPHVFRFRHALLQEATYLGLLRSERRDLHARAAAAVEATESGRLPELAAVLGRHYAIAEDAGRAVQYFDMAGAAATGAFANDEAISSFRAALAVTQGAGASMAADGARLHAKLANVLWRLARQAEARDSFHEALRLGGSLDALQRAHLFTRLGRLELTELRYEAATAAFDAAEALLGDNPGGRDDATADQWLEIMVDGRADIHVTRFETDEALAILEAARPVLEVRGTPARWTAFDRLFTMQRLMRNRFRVDDADIATLRRSIEAAEHTGEDKDLGYAIDFLGWAHWLRGDLAEATENLEKAQAMAYRIGESHLHVISLLALTLTALRRHDTEAVRTLSSQAFKALAEVDGRVAMAMACQAWLAWQDERPDEVLRLAAQIAEINQTMIGHGARYRWVYLFPVIAARQTAGAVAEAVTAARQILDPAQMLLPDELTAALESSCAAWDRADQEAASKLLATALTLARDLHFF